MLKKIACEHWEIEDYQSMSLFDDNGDKILIIPGSDKSVFRFVEMNQNKEVKYKDLPQDPVK